MTVYFETLFLLSNKMGIFFAKKKPPSRVTEQDKAILQLKQTRDKIKQYQRRIEQNLEKERLIAKKLIQNKQRDRALLLLRKKKFQEHILSKTDGHLENLERMVHDLEFAQVEVKVIDGLKVGNASLKKLHDLLSIDDIEKVLDETREGIEKQKEIDEMLSGELTDNDESEAKAELDAFLAADVEEKAPKAQEDVTLQDVPQDVTFPEVPEELPGKKKERTKDKTAEPVALEA